MACGDGIGRFNVNISKYCAYAKCKEGISHMLYECTRSNQFGVKSEHVCS